MLSAQQTLMFEFSRFQCDPEQINPFAISTDGSRYDVVVLQSYGCDGRGGLTFYRVDDAPHYPLPMDIDV